MFKNRAKRGILMFINVQLMIINVQDLREAQKPFFSFIKLAAIISCRKRA